MGMWGVKLYQNDMAADIRDEFEESFRNGKTCQKISDELIECYSGVIGNIEEEPVFWFALADTQWNYGVLLPFVKEKALYWIDNECELLKSRVMDSANKKNRETVLRALKTKLLSPQPPIKPKIKKRIYQCQWKLGDVFAYKMESELAKEKKLDGGYLLIQKIDENVWDCGHVVPIVYVKISVDGQLPTNVIEYDKLKYIQTGFAKYEERFWPIDMSRPQEDVFEKSKIDYKVDEYGFLPKYRATLLNTSKKIIPSKLIYVGNFISALRPKNEFIPHSKINIPVVSWKCFNETFETTMIKRYYWHNLRELSIYTS